MKGESGPFCFNFANFLILKRIKQALGLDEAKMFCFGAAPLKQSSIDYFASLDIPLFNYYGLSETTGGIVGNNVTRFNLNAAGYPLPGMDVKIDNPNEEQIGEICIKGRLVMLGYYKNEDATREIIDPKGYFHSGDLGKIDEQGFLRITGRIKELIITAGGENVAPIIIEDTIKLTCPYINNVMVIGEN